MNAESQGTAPKGAGGGDAELWNRRTSMHGGDWKLPCDVRLPPATTINAGCALSTLLHAMELRAEAGVTRFPPKKVTAVEPVSGILEAMRAASPQLAGFADRLTAALAKAGGES